MLHSCKGLAEAMEFSVELVITIMLKLMGHKS